MEENFIPTETEIKSNKKNLIITIISLVLVIVLAVTSALLVKKYVITTFIVDGISMYPSLDGGNGAFPEGTSDIERTNGEVLYLNRVAKIKRGNIVVFAPQWPGIQNADGSYKSLVKRVIAIGGDHILITGYDVYVNGSLVDEYYINQDEKYYQSTPIEYTIEDGYIFCMGDNRAHSSDCRNFGPVSLDCVVGKCFLVKGLNGKLHKPN